jgi:hypothetical protein
MALLQNINFTDPQGVEHTAATFGVSYATRYVNQNSALNRNMVDMTTMTENNSVNANINVQYYYWADDAKRLAGNSPYILANMNLGGVAPTMSFNFDVAGVEYDGLTLEAQCYYYLENTILV